MLTIRIISSKPMLSETPYCPSILFIFCPRQNLSMIHHAKFIYNISCISYERNAHNGKKYYIISCRGKICNTLWFSLPIRFILHFIGVALPLRPEPASSSLRRIDGNNVFHTITWHIFGSILVRAPRISTCLPYRCAQSRVPTGHQG